MKYMNKEKSIEILAYILIFCTFMGSNFLKFNVLGINFNIGRGIMLLAAAVTVIDIITSVINHQKTYINFKNNHVKYIVCFFIVWSIYALVSIYKAIDIKAFFIINFYICIGTMLIIFFCKNINVSNKKNNIYNMILIPVFINCLYYLYLFFVKGKDIGRILP